jgi:hypothetical protein
MTSLQLRIASYAKLSADLITQLSELDELCDRVREAQLATRKSLRYTKRKRPPAGGVKFKRERVTPSR